MQKSKGYGCNGSVRDQKEEYLIVKAQAPYASKLAGAKSCFSIKWVVLLIAGPTCQTWFTVSAFPGTLTVAKILKVPLLNSALGVPVAKEMFPGTTELYDERLEVIDGVCAVLEVGDEGLGAEHLVPVGLMAQATQPPDLEGAATKATAEGGVGGVVGQWSRS
ncbi:hypothetical protein M0R45_010215 [Rubus argutus]|uniref:Uncharacterized protein n=1 Tax=Rubus argutus TaxID=59490 RepID=A0AAW1Y9C5_RUBAR